MATRASRIALAGSNISSTGEVDADLLDNTDSAAFLSLNGSGFLGIGTASPQRHVVLYSPTASGQTNLQFQNSTTGTAAGDGFGVGMDAAEKGFIWNYESNDTYIGGTTGGTSITVAGSSGKVGIGTNTPTEKLHIKSGGNAYKMLILESESGDAGLLLQGQGGNQFSIQQNSNQRGLFFYDRTAGQYRIFIDPNGKVGIGTPSPSVILDISSTDAIRIPVGTTAQRPSTPATGYFRLNTTSNATEIFKNGTWSTFAETGMVTSGLRLHWDMTNSSSYSGSGTSVIDLSGNGYTGTIVGNPTYSTNSGGYLVFDGNGDRITSTMTAPSGARAYGMWVYYTSTTQSNGEGYQLSGIQAGGGYTYQGIVNGGSVYFYVGTGTGGTVSPAFNLSAGNWYYQVLTFDGTNYNLYVNGVSIQTGTASTGTTSTTFSAGAMNSNYHLYGYGSEWQFYDKGLTAAEVLQNFNAGKGRYGL